MAKQNPLEKEQGNVLILNAVREENPLKFSSGQRPSVITWGVNLQGGEDQVFLLLLAASLP